MRRNDQLGRAEFTIQTPLGATTVILTPNACQVTPVSMWHNPAGDQCAGTIILDPQDGFAAEHGRTTLQTHAGTTPPASVQVVISDGMADAVRAWITEHPGNA